ncbi:tail fiber protein, partial [Salmonella enterica subsp. enterica serovar Morehead]
MGKLTETTQWEDDIYQLETSDPVLGGPDGVSNKPQKQLANRTQWLKQQLETTNSALANHAKSRNHPDASLTAKGFVQLYSGVMSDSEILAATPKAVKIAMDNANARLAKDQNLSDVPDKAKGRSSLEVYSKTESDENYMAKSQCGADIPNKPLFIENLGLAEAIQNLFPVGAPIPWP